MISVLYTSTVLGAGYTCPTYKEYISCNPGYILNSTGPGNACVPAPTCDAGYYLTDAGECDKCPSGYYCADGVKNACPDRFMYYTPDFPDDFGAVERVTGVHFLESGRTGSVNDCNIESWVITERGYLYERLDYNQNTKLYDSPYLRLWHAVRPGYYLLKPRSCGAYAYYDAILECEPGYYCPGKETVVCNAENKAEVYTSTFGLEPCPAGTYSGPGQSACTVCPDNTWSDGGASECTMCPGIADGYGNRGDVAENHAGPASCTTQCNAGYYVPNVGDACTQIQGDIPYYAESHTVAYGDTSGDNYKKCPDPAPGQGTGDLYSSDIWRHTSVNYCALRGVPMVYTYNPEIKFCRDGDCISQQTTHGVVKNTCYYTSGDDGMAIYDDTVINDGRGCEGESSLVSCDAGFWAPVRSYAHAGYFLGCQPVGVGYYSPDGDLNRYPCPDGTMTVGFGNGAAAASSCMPYRKLHAGDKTLQLSAQQYTTPALAVQMPDGARYYGYMIAGGRGDAINMAMPAGVYSIINPLDQFERGTVLRYGTSPAFDIIIVP